MRQRFGVFRCRSTPCRLRRDVVEQGPRVHGFEIDIVAIVVGVHLLHFRQGDHELFVELLAEDAGHAGLEHLGGDVATQVHRVVPVLHEQVMRHPEHLGRQLAMRPLGDVRRVEAQVCHRFVETGRRHKGIGHGKDSLVKQIYIISFIYAYVNITLQNPFKYGIILEC